MVLGHTLGTSAHLPCFEVIFRHLSFESSSPSLSLLLLFLRFLILLSLGFLLFFHLLTFIRICSLFLPEHFILDLVDQGSRHLEMNLSKLETMNLPLIHYVTRYKQHEMFSWYESDIHFLHSFTAAMRHSVKAAKIPNFLVVILNHLRSFFAKALPVSMNLFQLLPRSRPSQPSYTPQSHFSCRPHKRSYRRTSCFATLSMGGCSFRTSPLRLASIIPM